MTVRSISLSGRPALRLLLEIIETLALTLIIFVVLQTFVAQPFKVEGGSMERSLEPDEFVLVDKLTPRFDAYKRGDVVVFDPPEEWALPTMTPFIKRVIGMAGDRVEIHDGKVWVNGVALDEPYIYAPVEGGPPDATDANAEAGTWVVPAGELFLMGDHRGSSEDSRVFGPVSVGSLLGRAWLRYWPVHAFTILSRPTYP
ncbi:MAG: signal peptidase I [Chloroflexota bacterium]